MPKLKNLSAGEVIKILQSFDFFVAGQRGSHVKLKKSSGDNVQTLTIPNHKELDKGTLKAIFKQSARYVSEEKLHGHFYDK